ncbi:MAG: dihydropteroate synthase [Promethearchaeia archaeon]
MPIYSKLFDFLEIGDKVDHVIMGVLNLSPESFYKGSVYTNLKRLEKTAKHMIENGAKILDLGARSTAPWSQKISVEEELKRITPALSHLCSRIPGECAISIDTQYKKIAQKAYEITQKYNKHMIVNDVSCLKTDPGLIDFVVEYDIPLIIMASEKVPGDLCKMEEIINVFQNTIQNLRKKGYNLDNLILDPGIGHWVEEKTYKYDLGLIKDLNRLQTLEIPILVAISRKSFIGETLNKPEPENRLNGTLSATAIAVFNGAHIVRTHDVTNQLLEITKMAKEIRERGK